MAAKRPKRPKILAEPDDDAGTLGVALDLGSIQFLPAVARGDGGQRRPAALILKATHRNESPGDLLRFVERARGLIAARFEPPDGLQVQGWRGFGSITAAHWKPPGDRARENGVADHPVVDLTFRFERLAETDVGGLIRFRLELDAAEAFTAAAILEVWQSDLPLGDPAGPEGLDEL